MRSLSARSSETLRISIKELAFYSLALLIFAIPWERSIGVEGMGAIGKIVGMVTISLGLLSLFSGRRITLRAPSLFLVVMSVFLMWSLLSFFWSIAPRATLSRSMTYAQLFLLVWLIWQLCRTRKQHLMLLQAYVLGGYISIASVIFAFLVGNTKGFRASGLDSNANWAALAIALAIPVAWHLFSLNKNSLLSWLNILYLPLGVFAIGLTASRGGMIASIVALTVVPLTYGRLGLLRKIGLLFLFSIALYGAYTLLPQVNLDRLAEAPNEITQGDLTQRKTIWKAGFEVYWRSPYVGSGSGTFSKAIRDVFHREKASHNAFIGILVGMGLVGVGLFISLLLIAIVPHLVSGRVSIFYLVLWATTLVALMPANWEIHKATWFVMAILTTKRAIVLKNLGIMMSPNPRSDSARLEAG